MSMTDERRSRWRRAGAGLSPSNEGSSPGEPSESKGGQGAENSVSADVHLPAKTEAQQGRGSGATMIAYDDIPDELAEALRGIVNRSELRTGSPLPQSIAVTSAIRGEGVTTVSKALAALIASELARSVCWIDCSWLSIHSGPEHDGRPSLIDILTDESRLRSAFEASEEQPSLVSLSPGPIPESKRNQVARSPEFEQLLGLMREEFDHVILDLPPVLSHANSIALLGEADASLLVVRHRATSIAQVERALGAMQPTPNLAVVLNQFRTSVPGRIRRLLGG
jgi:Mrp family chromosome partitioning ATPase